MFKERLKISGKKALPVLGEILLIVVLLSIIIGIAFLAVEYPTFGTIVEYIFYVIVGLFLLIVLICVSTSIGEFVHWLFIEPYKERKKKRNEN